MDKLAVHLLEQKQKEISQKDQAKTSEICLIQSQTHCKEHCAKRNSFDVIFRTDHTVCCRSREQQRQSENRRHKTVGQLNADRRACYKAHPQKIGKK